ncbi:MAG: iron-sulfur cluster assembly accessory protein [Pseudomonadota bacterium]
MPAPHLHITPAAKARILSRRADAGDAPLYLRLLVDGGGCSGFQYQMDWVTAPQGDETILEDAIVTDDMSLTYLTGATLDFTKTLMGEDFQIVNPNATSSCGCGTSFSIG